ncbi:seven transmembrane receptor-like protein [Schizosaccharomyces japonicus yFS275]|uniref:Seven transmembrane receptor-like protein n=1 Tax=Schizosaccharomyces japonicus (strain yFS275 / FY16936) TaxID=402676 RepID=B6K199_SCHJY|nr:seven transmembrane receptor-like protein [Schizosaccharomyces japonicus yFS275]EEB07720.1 seven transmembrane receptor-like protein [Schizosaccharomyces japonicus yFS275]
MKVKPLTVFSALSALSLAHAASLTSKHPKACNPIYSKREAGGTKPPTIQFNWTESVKEDNSVHVVFYDWREQSLLGLEREDGSIAYVCDEDAVEKDQLCSRNQLGDFLWNNTNARTLKQFNVTKEEDYASAIYEVPSTGYYCALSRSHKEEEDYAATVSWNNPYGRLDASQFPRYPTSCGLTIAYSVILTMWMFYQFQYRSNMLPVQHTIRWLLIFCIVDQAINSWVFDAQNRTGTTFAIHFGQFVMSILFALRMVIDLGILFSISLGFTRQLILYLEQIRAKYAMQFSVLFPVLFMTRFCALVTQPYKLNFFYVILLAVQSGVVLYLLYEMFVLLGIRIQRSLEQRKFAVRQNYRIVRGLVILLAFFFAFLFIVNVSIGVQSRDKVANKFWKVQWFYVDGWLDVLHLFIIITISFLWKPSPKNQQLDYLDMDTGFALPSDMEEELDLFDESETQDEQNSEI